ncbi:MAG TPA: gamma-glutamylcyclotransferase family protein, partial [Candidatus Baltobacteraceae bacterium]|nr:gamma-glutamylcyclotransferase family protein [Candidatus Baltobacteraceae bacterium]
MKDGEQTILRAAVLDSVEHLPASVGFPMKMYLAVYGTLSDNNGVPFAQGELSREIQAQLVDSGSFKIKGTLYDLGPYPGFVLQGETPIHGRLLEIKRPHILKSLDTYEEYDPQCPEESQFIRRFIMLDEPKVAAWIYVY